MGLRQGDVVSLPPVEVMTCHKCRSKTRWLLGRGGKFSHCEGCNDRFPCAHACAHLDCKDAREVSKP